MYHRSEPAPLTDEDGVARLALFLWTKTTDPFVSESLARSLNLLLSYPSPLFDVLPFLRRYVCADGGALTSVASKFILEFKSEEVVDESLAHVMKLFTTILVHNLTGWCNGSAGVVRDILVACQRQLCCGSAIHTPAVLQAAFQGLK